jgi:transporter family protein
LYSLATGLCVGAGTILFFQMFQRGAPLSSVPIVLAVGSGIMVLAGVVIFHDALGWRHWIGVLLALGAILLLRST